jgi:hypothetical protein
VWFVPSKSAPIPAGSDGRCAAIITHVHHDRLVNLAVFDANSHLHPRTSVPLVQEGDPKPEAGGYCEWMPYQKGQASKYEELERQLKEKAQAANAEAAGKWAKDHAADKQAEPAPKEMAGKDQPARKGRP